MPVETPKLISQPTIWLEPTEESPLAGTCASRALGVCGSCSETLTQRFAFVGSPFALPSLQFSLHQLQEGGAGSKRHLSIFCFHKITIPKEIFKVLELQGVSKCREKWSARGIISWAWKEHKARTVTRLRRCCQAGAEETKGEAERREHRKTKTHRATASKATASQQVQPLGPKAGLRRLSCLCWEEARQRVGDPASRTEGWLPRGWAGVGPFANGQPKTRGHARAWVYAPPPGHHITMASSWGREGTDESLRKDLS